MTAHLLGIDGMDRAEIEELLDLTDTFAEIGRRPIARVPALRGRTVATPVSYTHLTLPTKA